MNKHSPLMSAASLGSLAALALLGAPSLATAQQSNSAVNASGTSTGSEETANELDMVVVTGSRLVTNGFQAPTPVTVVSSEQLRQSAPTSLSESLNQLPVFRNSSTPQSTGVGTTGNVGQSFLNLRSLGTARTLILLDGRRVVPSSSAGTTDVSVLPEALVRRVEVVTGGASAAWGSDAVAGVVNFLLDTKFEGVKANLQGSIAEAGDATGPRVELTAGSSFGNGRGHIVGSVGYYKNTGIERWGDRNWYDSCSRISNPALNPATVMACNVHSAGFTSGGLITSGPLKGIEFGPGGVPQTFTYGDLASTLSMVGGSGEDHGANFPAMPGVTRKTAFSYLSYDLTDNVTPFVEVLFAEANAHYASTAPWEGQSTGFTIYNDNYFLPTSIKTQMATAGVTSFPMWRYDYDFGLLLADSRNRTSRITTGIDATLGEWKLKVYYEHGENKYHQTTQNNPIINRLYNAVDVVAGPNGQPICRSTLAQPGNGCVPLNLFGFGSPSAAALAWVTGTTVQDQIVKQDVAEVSIGGSPFSSWAGPVSVAAGGGYRRESSAQTVDDTATLLRHFTGDYRGWPTALEGQLGGWERTNPQPLAGHYDVKEAFAEVGIPLLVDSPLGESLELNGAIRYTDYSTSGEVTTWKTGLVYRPIADIQLRATLSRDIRAANINEMFTGPTQGQANLTDPAYPVGDPNNRPVVIARSFGNPVLKPERADTTAVGVILRPRFLPGFTASIDYYDIDIRDAINTLGSQTIIDQCFQGATALCSLLHRDSTGVLVSVDTPYLNIARRATDGIDLETAYQIQLGSGMLNVRGLATYIHKLTTENPGAAVIDAAGQTGGGGGVPHWMANLSADWKTSGGFGLFVQERYIGPGALDKTLPATTLDPAANHVASVFYTDLTLSRQFGTPNEHHLNAQAFFTISNLFNRAPPMAPAAYFVFGASNGGTNASLFDIVGRQYTAGIRLRF